MQHHRCLVWYVFHPNIDKYVVILIDLVLAAATLIIVSHSLGWTFAVVKVSGDDDDYSRTWQWVTSGKQHKYIVLSFLSTHYTICVGIWFNFCHVSDSVCVSQVFYLIFPCWRWHVTTTIVRWMALWYRLWRFYNNKIDCCEEVLKCNYNKKPMIWNVCHH